MLTLVDGNIYTGCAVSLRSLTHAGLVGVCVFVPLSLLFVASSLLLFLLAVFE